MKKSMFLAFVPSLLMMACMDTTQLDQSKSAASETITAEGEASASLYFGDISESAKEKPKKEELDDSVKKDMKESRVKNMAQKMMDRLDADDSGSLSEAEFLALGIHPNKEKAAEQTPEELAKIQEKLKAEFAKFAGEDKLLSLEELPEALKGQGPRVGGFRKEKHAGKNEDRKKEIEKELLTKYDKDGDGKLSPEELALVRADDKKECKDRAGKGKPDGGKPDGGMPDGDPEGGKPKDPVVVIPGPV